MEKQKRLFCFGYGYTAEYLGRALKARGWRVAGTTRDVEKLRRMKAEGVEAFLFDEEIPLIDPARILGETTHLLFSIPPENAGDLAFLLHGHDIAEIRGVEWAGYLSTTGVYGNRDGGWVSEESETRPETRRGARRMRAEDQWLSLLQSYGLPVHIFRLAGIYGPGRSAIDSVRAGNARRIDKPGHAFSRIHIEDIIQVLLASIEKPNPGRIYNLADDRAAPSHEVIACACELLGLKPLPLLPYVEADLAPITLSFYSDNKRVHNDRIKTELGVTLRYPDFIGGLKACLEAEKDPTRFPSLNTGDSQG